MTPFERAADRYDVNSRARKRARSRRAQLAELKADIAYVLADAEAVLISLPNRVVTTPRGITTVKDVTGHIQRLVHRLTPARRPR